MRRCAVTGRASAPPSSPIEPESTHAPPRCHVRGRRPPPVPCRAGGGCRSRTRRHPRSGSDPGARSRPQRPSHRPPPEATPAPELTPPPEPSALASPDPTVAPEPVPDPSPVPFRRRTARTRPVAGSSSTGTARTSPSRASATQSGWGSRPTERSATRSAGFAARLSPAQVTALRADPAVLAVVPDEKIELAAQSIPTGINRIDGRLSAAAKIDGVDERVDADVAIVDTGIDPNRRPERRRRLQLLDLGPRALARRPRPRDARRRDGRRDRQPDGRRRRRARRPALGREDPQRQRFGAALLVRLRARLDRGPA